MRTRFDNAVANLATGIISEIALVVASLIARKVLVATMGSEYLGISSLFSSILSMLSLAELGIGTSIVYHMYKPVAEKDHERTLEFFYFFKNVYYFIGIIIAIIGIVILPLLKYIVTDLPGNLNVSLLFIVYLLQTLSTYFFMGYRRSLIQVNQKQYIINNTSFIITMLTLTGQIAVLLIFRNIYLYIIVRAFTTIFENIMIGVWCQKLFPYSNRKPAKPLDRESKRGILKDCIALLIYRINGVVLYSTDNLIVTHYLGLAVMGVYSNFTWISTIIKKVTSMLFNSVADGVGNLHASAESVNQELYVFSKLNLITAVINAIAMTGLINVSDLFIRTVFGENMTISFVAIILLAIDVYLAGIVKLINTYRNSYGLFQQAKYRPIFSTLLNAIISILLVKTLGLVGILLGTVVSVLLTTYIYDSYIVFRYGFGSNVISFHLKNGLYFLLASISCGMTYFVSHYVVPPLYPWVAIILNTFFSIIITLMLFYCILGRTEDFQSIIKYVFAILCKIHISKRRRQK